MCDTESIRVGCSTCLFRDEPIAGPCAVCEAPTLAMWIPERFVNLHDVWVEIARRLARKRAQQALAV